MPTNSQIRVMIERLEKQEKELAARNHLGWGNLDYDAAAMLRTLLAERTWRDMDSAPMDGTQFLAWGSYDYPGDISPTEYTSIVEARDNEEFPWRDVDGDNQPGVFTKWLPLSTPDNTWLVAHGAKITAAARMARTLPPF